MGQRKGSMKKNNQIVSLIQKIVQTEVKRLMKPLVREAVNEALASKFIQVMAEGQSAPLISEALQGNHQGNEGAVARSAPKQSPAKRQPSTLLSRSQFDRDSIIREFSMGSEGEQIVESRQAPRAPVPSFAQADPVMASVFEDVEAAPGESSCYDGDDEGFDIEKIMQGVRQ